MIRNRILLALLVVWVLTGWGTAERAEDGVDPFAPVSGVPEGCMIIEGDIIVPLDWFERKEAGPSIEACFDDNWWPNGIVPYEFNSNVDATNRQRAIDAMAEWVAVADLDFRPRSGESDYVHIQNSTVNSSYVGRQGGKQVINIASWGSHFIIVHELGHALGLWHEQSRTDRDTYVIINWDRIESDKEHNFEKESGSHSYGPYDFDSVMHYGQCSFSTCASCGADLANCRTITVRSPWDAQWQDDIGQRNHLSDLDQLTMSLMYPEWNWVFVDGTYGGSENGTFLRPWDTFQEGASDVQSGGTVVIQRATYSCVGVYTKAMTLYAPRGGVLLTD